MREVTETKTKNETIIIIRLSLFFYFARNVQLTVQFLEMRLQCKYAQVHVLDVNVVGVELNSRAYLFRGETNM